MLSGRGRDHRRLGDGPTHIDEPGRALSSAYACMHWACSGSLSRALSHVQIRPRHVHGTGPHLARRVTRDWESPTSQARTISFSCFHWRIYGAFVLLVLFNFFIWKNVYSLVFLILRVATSIKNSQGAFVNLFVTNGGRPRRERSRSLKPWGHVYGDHIEAGRITTRILSELGVR